MLVYQCMVHPPQNLLAVDMHRSLIDLGESLVQQLRGRKHSDLHVDILNILDWETYGGKFGSAGELNHGFQYLTVFPSR